MKKHIEQKTVRKRKTPKVRRNNPTTNSSITEKMFKKECYLFDNGMLPNEHDKYMGERL